MRSGESQMGDYSVYRISGSPDESEKANNAAS